MLFYPRTYVGLNPLVLRTKFSLFDQPLTTGETERMVEQNRHWKTGKQTKPPLCHFVPHKSHVFCIGIKLEPQNSEASDYRLIYFTAK